MTKYTCETCQKIFSQKGHLEDHNNRKRPCKKDNTIEALVEKKVQEALSKTTTIDYTKKSRDLVEDTNFSMLEECLEKISIKEVADKLNLCVGTIRRWIELKDVPIQYTFDLCKILSKDIDYSKYTSTLKDQFFTPRDLAKKCWETFNREVKIQIQKNIPLSNHLRGTVVS